MISTNYAEYAVYLNARSKVLQGLCFHVYLSLPGYGVLEQEVGAFWPVLIDVVSLGGEQKALVGIVGEWGGRRGRHRLVAGVPAPVAAGGAAVARRQRLLPGRLRYCSWKTHTWWTVV